MPCHFFPLCNDAEGEGAMYDEQVPLGLFGKRQAEGEGEGSRSRAVESIINVLLQRQRPVPEQQWGIGFGGRCEQGDGASESCAICQGPPRHVAEPTGSNGRPRRENQGESQDGRAGKSCQGPCPAGTRGAETPDEAGQVFNTSSNVSRR